MSTPLFALASSWRWGTFADVATVASNLVDPAKTPEAAHIAPNHIESWTGRLLPYGTIQDDGMTSAKHQFRAGHILYSKIRPYLAKAALATFDGLCSADMYPIETSLEPSFLLRWMLSPSFTNAASRTQGRTVLPKINRVALDRLPVPVAPINEQRCIVAKLDAMFEQTRAAKARLERLPALLEKLKRSILAAAFRGDLTADWRAANPNVESASALLDRIRAERRRRWEDALRDSGKDPKGATFVPPTPADSDGLPDLPEGWAWASVDEFALVVRGASPRPAGDPRYFGGSVPWITVRELTKDANMEILDVSESLTAEGKDNSRHVEAGTFLLSNSGATLGVPKITRLAGCINDGVVALLHVSEPEKQFLYYFLTGQTEVLRAMNQGAAQPNLNTGIVKRIAVPVPPEREREELVRRVGQALRVVDGLSSWAGPSAARLAQVEQAALAKAFRGELVPQDPDDEPASVLLDRIRAARAAEPAKPGRGRAARREQPTPKPPAVAPTPGAEVPADDPLDLVVAVFQQGTPRLSASTIIDVTGLRAKAVTTALKALVDAGQVRVHGRAKGTTYEWTQ